MVSLEVFVYKKKLRISKVVTFHTLYFVRRRKTIFSVTSQIRYHNPGASRGQADSSLNRTKDGLQTLSIRSPRLIQ